MRWGGCLLVLLVIGGIVGEVYLALWLAHRFEEPFGVILGVLATSIVGFKVAKYHVAKLPLDMLSGNLGRRMVAIIGGALLLFPGFASDVIGLILLIPLVQKPLAGVAGRLAQALMRQAMQQMGGKAGFPTMPGGFPGAMPGGMPMFPGMQPKGGFQPLKPDEVARFGMPPLPPKGKKPGTYDTTAEKDEG